MYCTVLLIHNKTQSLKKKLQKKERRKRKVVCVLSLPQRLIPQPHEQLTLKMTNIKAQTVLMRFV